MYWDEQVTILMYMHDLHKHKASQETTNEQKQQRKIEFLTNNMRESQNRGTPKSSILMGFSIINRLF